jgi:hypothetical protein
VPSKVFAAPSLILPPLLCSHRCQSLFSCAKDKEVAESGAEEKEGENRRQLLDQPIPLEFGTGTRDQQLANKGKGINQCVDM